jgi:hypothetical protein
MPDRNSDETETHARTPVDAGLTAAREPEETLVKPIQATVPRSFKAASADGPLEPGVCLRNRYVLEEAIGAGAMGQVWRARDLLSEEAHDRNPYVAIKVLRGEAERFKQSFAAMHREASRTQKLAHPNIVTVFTLDRDDASGRVFIAMELLDGEPLDRIVKRMRQERVEPQDPWSIVRGMAEGLAYAHRKGIVHSDFKPGNVFLTREGVPKILDFGIARAARIGNSAQERADDTDDVISGYTERYAAPEVLEDAEPHPADDVFALGLVAYELLTGEYPLARRNAVEARDAGFVPAPIKGLSRRQWKVLQRALAYRRADRWQNAAEFLQALQKRTHLQIALAVSLAALVLTAAGLSYRNYLNSLPAVPFEALPAEQQAAVRAALSDGAEALRYVRDSGLIEASADAADRFADAYALHPRNPEAVAGLKEAADRFIAYWADRKDPDRALEELRKFRSKSEFYAGYAPLEKAIERYERR